MGSIERFLALAGMACCCWSARAHAEPGEEGNPPTRDQCLDAHEHAQAVRLSGDLLRARLALRQCSAAACPTLVSRDCMAWLTEVEQQIPSVIFRATRDGTDLIQVRVLEGERELASAITGTPLELEPGVHHFRAELAGFPPQQTSYILQAGDKARVVGFAFVSPQATPPPAAVPPPAAAPAARDVPESRPVPTLTYVLGGTALAAVISGGVLGAMALSERDEREASCAPLCTPQELDRVSNLALATDVSFVVAALAGGAAVYTYLTRPSVGNPPSVAPSLLGVRLGQAGWSVSTGGRF
ncbi:MAG TPA: hypothetical protein VIW29_11680 [Polyangiaceae bacterium]